MSRLGTKNRQLQQAEACKTHLRATYPDKLRLVEEYIAEFEGEEIARWSASFTDAKRSTEEMLSRVDAAFQRWLNGE